MVRSTLLVFAIIFANSASTVLATDIESSVASKVLAVNIGTPSSSYVLGEIIPLNIEFVNSGSEAAYLFGSTEILISNRSGDYLSYSYMGKRYSFDGVEIPVKIEPESKYRISLSILWNWSPDVSHLEPFSAKRSSKGRILTDYAFIESGEYLVKVRHSFMTEESIRDEVLQSVASTPIRISVEDPKGEESEVWKIIRQNGEFAYFMQNGDFFTPFHKKEQRAALVGSVENLIDSYPATVYSKAFRKGLEIYKLREIKRNASIELLKRLARPNSQICKLNLCRYDTEPK